MNKTTIIKNAFFSFLKSFVTLLSPIITFPYASRILMPEGIGKINFANSVILYFIILAELGIGKYATREIAKVKNNLSALTQLTKEIFLINLISTLISYGLFIISIIIIKKFSDYRLLLIICSSKILFTTIGMDWFYNGMEEFKYISFRSIFFQVISILYLFLFVKSSDDYIEYAIFTLISSVGSNFLNFLHIHKFLSFRLKVPINLTKHLKYIFTFFGMTLVTSVYEILDTTMLGFLVNDFETGIYSASTKIIRMAIDVINSISAVFLPRLSQYFSQNKSEEFDSLLSNSFKIISLLVQPIMVGIFLLTPSLIIIFCGTSFSSSILPMRILCSIVFFISFSNLIACQILPAINKEKISMISFICAAVSNILFNLLLIPKYGAVGAAIGTTIAEFFAFIIPFIFISKYFFKYDILKNFLQSTIATIVMGIVIFFLLKIINNIFLKILINIIIGVIVYFSVLILQKNKIIFEIIEKIKYKISKN